MARCACTLCRFNPAGYLTQQSRTLHLLPDSWPVVDQQASQQQWQQNTTSLCAACRDAQDAARGRDGYDFYGNRLRVEMSRGARDRGPPPAPPTFRGRGTGFRVLIKGLPISASCKDLKVSAFKAAFGSLCIHKTVVHACLHHGDPAHSSSSDEAVC